MSDGNSEQVRVVAEQVADAAIVRFHSQYPERAKPQAEIPAPLKWAGGIIAALFTMGVGAMGVWLVTTVSSMQVTLARMDERQQLTAPQQDARFVDDERRITRLESFHTSEHGQ